MRGFLVLIACSGCSSILGIDDFKLGDAGTSGDGMPDGPGIDVPDNCLGPAGFAVCLTQMPTQMFRFDAASSPIDTTPGSSACAATQPPGWSAQGQPDACFIIATSISIDVTMRATGSRPLVLVATDSITLLAGGGSIDAAAHRGQALAPPGAPSAECMVPQPPDENGGFIGHGGGAGGSFMTRGGPGGIGGGGQNQGGQPASTSGAPTKLRAGCSGGFGGRGQGVNPPGGLGGGAVYLLAQGRVAIDGTINVSGAGGVAGSSSSGGSGGGAGGMLVVHAMTISGNGILIANGGGGAGGSSTSLGTPGADPSPTSPLQSANGGGGAGAPGGNGFAGTQQAGPGGMAGANNTGGGGGGGGGGYIRLNVQAPATFQISPAPSIVP